MLSVAKAESNISSQEVLDVTLGDVYLFTGQSNVDLPESYALQTHPRSQRAEEEFAEEMGRKGLIRIMIVPNQVPGLNYGRTPAHELTNSPDCRLCPPPFGPHWNHSYKVCHCNSLRWARVSSANIRGFSALGWFSGAALARTQPLLSGVPLGLVRSSWGGTKILRWSGPDAVKRCPQSRQPRGQYADLFANMIYPMAKLHFSAVVWMHGASDTGQMGDFLGPDYYGCALPALIKDWREKFERDSLPFIVVELPAYCNERDWATFHTFCDSKKSILSSTEYHLPAMRIAQTKAEELPLVYMVTAMDLGSLHPIGGSIHSDKKQELGVRVAMAARAAVYGEKDVIWAAPKAFHARMTQPDHISVHFSTRPNEFLVLNNSARCPEQILPIYCTGGGFEVFSNGTWVPALSAWLGQDKSVVLRTVVNASIERIRYAYADWPVCSLRSAVTGLPARIFDLPVVVEKFEEPPKPVLRIRAKALEVHARGGGSNEYLGVVEKDIAQVEQEAQKLERKAAPVFKRAVSVVEEKSREGVGVAEGYVTPHWPIAALASIAFLGTICVCWHAAMSGLSEGRALQSRTASRQRVLECNINEEEEERSSAKALLSPPNSETTVSSVPSEEQQDQRER